jgi:hypothetical protein
MRGASVATVCADDTRGYEPLAQHGIPPEHLDDLGVAPSALI